MSTDATTSTVPTHLPDDPAVLQSMIHELLEKLRESERAKEGLQHRLDQVLRRLFGPRAERVDPNQPVLFAELTALPPPPAPPPAPASTKKHRKHGRRKLPADLPRQRCEYTVAEAELPCPDCGTRRVVFGQEASEQLDYHPASLFVTEHVRFKYVCPCCQGQVVIAPKPPQPIAKGVPGPGLLAHIITCKYADHLPLHRQERILARHGIDLRRSTTCGWMAACADLLRPLYERMKTLVLESRVIHTDDSPMPVLDRERDTTRRGHMWTYLGDGKHPYSVFDFSPNHQQGWAIAFLDCFHGYLQADAYQGYDTLYAPRDGTVRIREVACWAHTRRKFFEAGTTDAARSTQALAYIRLLYQIEHEAALLTDATRHELRQAKAVPLLTAIRQWLEQEQQQVLPKSPMGQAIAYALGNWEALCRYTTAGFLAIDNNVAERTLRDFVTGRKNWLFAGSDTGGKTAAVLFSFTATCKRHGVDPFGYLRDVLTRLPTQPADRLDDLLPDRWTVTPKAAAAPNTS